MRWGGGGVARVEVSREVWVWGDGVVGSSGHVYEGVSRLGELRWEDPSSQ